MAEEEEGGEPEPRKKREKVVHYCAWCGAVATKRCVCMRAHYCSKVCQDLDWSRHEPLCIPLSGMKECAKGDEEGKREQNRKRLRVLADDILRAGGSVAFFTGAGISVAAGIRPYRGPTGVYDLKKRGEPIPRFPDLSAIRPTRAHRAMAEFVNSGLARGVITTNVDGLHLAGPGGLDDSRVTELHGSRHWEQCDDEACGYRVVRDYDVVARAAGADYERSALMGSEDSTHIFTGNTCARCGKRTMRTAIVLMGDRLPLDKWNAAMRTVENVQVLVLCGTSLPLETTLKIISKARKSAFLNLEKTALAFCPRVVNVICEDVQDTMAELLDLCLPRRSPPHPPPSGETPGEAIPVE